jgi:hypothetical protein
VKRTLAILIITVVMLVAALVISSFSAPKVTVFCSSPVVTANGTRFPQVHLTLDVTNQAARAVILNVVAVERHFSTGWVADMPYPHIPLLLGNVPANSTLRLSSYDFPYEPVPTRLRVSVELEATPFQKAQFALGRLWTNLRGRGHYKQFWITNLTVPSYEITTTETP